MEIKLVRAGIGEAENLWKMKVEAFRDLYEKYGDTDTSPATETLEKTIMRLESPSSYYYYISVEGENIGAVRVVYERREDAPKRISRIFILPQHRNKGYAQAALLLAEEIHGSSGWELETILQEKGNCHLYEKLGYYQTGATKIINDKMTLVFYKKD